MRWRKKKLNRHHATGAEPINVARPIPATRPGPIHILRRRAAARAPPTATQMRSRPARMAAGPTPSAAAASFRPPIPPPPPCFNYRAAVLADTRAAAAAAGDPALAGLVESGALVRVPRRRFGPVPAWRPPDFVEPDEVWILGTSHLSPDSVADVERVLRAVQPDNVVVELCRSRQGHAFH